MSLPSPWPSSQTIGHSQWNSIQFYIWLFLLSNEVNNQWHISNLKMAKKNLSLKTKLWASKSLQFYIKTYYTKTEIALYILILKYFLYFPYRECDFQYFLYLFFIWFKKFSNYAIKIRNKYHPSTCYFPFPSLLSPSPSSGTWIS